MPPSGTTTMTRTQPPPAATDCQPSTLASPPTGRPNRLRVPAAARPQMPPLISTTTLLVYAVLLGVVALAVARRLSLTLTLALVTSILSLPLWLPRLVVALRFRIFTAINGPEGMPLPSKDIAGAEFTRIYNHPGARVRSKQNGVGLTDFFWYLLSPVHYLHQEHLESDDPLYKDAAQASARILTRLRPRQLHALAAAEAAKYFAAAAKDESATSQVVRLRQFFFPLFARLFHELIFEEPCPPGVEDLIFASAENIIAALKCTTTRDMALRARLTAYLEQRLVAGDAAWVFAGSGMDLHQQALHLQGVFFHTGAVQLSEAMAHMVLCIAQHPGLQDRMIAEQLAQQAQSWSSSDADEASSDGEDKPETTTRSNNTLLQHVIKEQLRVFPLFGVAHRIVSEDIPSAGGVIERGTVLLFNYQAFQTSPAEGLDNPTAFDPDRWDALRRDPPNYMPFGAPRNRPCPGKGLSLVWMDAIGAVFVRHFAAHSPVEHTRSMPDGGLCLLETRAAAHPLPAWRRAATISSMALLERLESVPRSLCQLVYGTYMILDSRRLALAVNYFQGKDIDSE